MGITVRPADLDIEREALFRVLEANLPYLPHRARFDWLYRVNPAGRAWCWFACADDGRVVGAASLFPRAVWVNGEIRRCGQVGDFAIEASHRTLGPAVMLQRATLGPVDRGEIDFCYDCPPHERGMSTFRRLGLEVTSETRRWARLVRADRAVAHHVPAGPWRPILAAAANAALGFAAVADGAERGLLVEAHAGAFGAEFTALDAAVSRRDGTRSRRAAEDLTWRYRADPVESWTVLTARRGGELVAFAAFTMRGDEAHVADVFGHLSAGVVRALLGRVARQAAAAGAQTVQTVVAHSDELAALLAAARFSVRADGPRIVAYDGAHTARAAWSLRYADLTA